MTIRSVIRPVIRDVIRPVIGGLQQETDPILALFAGGVPGFYFRRDASPYFQLSTGTTPAGDNDPVGYIGDLSPNGYHATQATAAERGVLVPQGVEFDGVDDYYTIPAAAAGDPSSSNTLVAVVRLDNASGERYILDGANGNDGLICRFIDGKIVITVIQTTGNNWAYGLTNIFDGNLHVVSFLYDRANQQLIGRVDGVLEASITTADADKTDVGSNLMFGFPGSFSYSKAWDGIIGDTLKIARALTDAELVMVEQTFAARWGVVLP